MAAPGCAPKLPALAPYPSSLPTAEAVVYLIGDAGWASGSRAILAQLKGELLTQSAESEVVVAFLGDNIYEKGLHPPNHPLRDADVRQLEAQLELVRGTSAKGVFVPGNHDWGYSGPRGVAQIRRQSTYVNERASDNLDVVFSPAAGCSGPEAFPIARSVLLVTLDTDWWLRDADELSGDGCEPASLDKATAALRAALGENARGSNRHVVVLAHHPLESYGPHGGYFGLKEQFFPLTQLWPPLYIPIPFIYPIIRMSGVSSQDISSPRYRRMREQLAGAFSEFAEAPLVFAAGHEHNLQVFRGEEYGVGYLLISGSGSKLTNVGRDDALFAAGRQLGEQGYMRLDFYRDKRVLLTVVTDGSAYVCEPRGTHCLRQPTVRYWRWLTGGE